MWNFLTKNIELQDKKIWKNILIGTIYFCSIVLLLNIGYYFLELPLLLVDKYNVSTNDIMLLYGNSYIWGIIGIMLVSVLSFPAYIALNRIKRRRKRWSRVLFR